MSKEIHYNFTEGKTYFIYTVDVNFIKGHGAFSTPANNYLTTVSQTFYVSKDGDLRTIPSGRTMQEHFDELHKNFEKDGKTITQVRSAPLVPFTIPYPPANINLKDFIDAFLEEKRDGLIHK